MTHDLKCWTEYFDLHITRAKDFELRKADRDFKPGDTLRLLEYDPIKKTFSGRVALSRVTCVLSGLPGLVDGYVALGTFFQQMEVHPPTEAAA